MSGFEEWWETQIAGHEDWQVDEWNVHRKPLLQKGWHARDAEIAALEAEMSAMKKSNCALCNRIVIWQEAWDEQVPALKERIAELTAPNQAQIVFDPSTAKRAKPHFYTEPEEPCDECEDKDARIAELEAEVAAMDISLAEMDYEADHDT